MNKRVNWECHTLFVMIVCFQYCIWFVIRPQNVCISVEYESAHFSESKIFRMHNKRICERNFDLIDCFYISLAVSIEFWFLLLGSNYGIRKSVSQTNMPNELLRSGAKRHFSEQKPLKFRFDLIFDRTINIFLNLLYSAMTPVQEPYIRKRYHLWLWSWCELSTWKKSFKYLFRKQRNKLRILI